MASLAQTCSGLRGRLAFNKNLHVQLLLSHNRGHLSNFQLRKPTICPLVMGRQRKQTRSEMRKQRKAEKWKAWCSNDGSSGSGMVPEFVPPSSAVDAVREFYDAFGARDIHKLEQVLLPHCVYHDLVLYGPYEGKQVSND